MWTSLFCGRSLQSRESAFTTDTPEGHVEVSSTAGLPCAPWSLRTAGEEKGPGAVNLTVLHPDEPLGPLGL